MLSKNSALVMLVGLVFSHSSVMFSQDEASAEVVKRAVRIVAVDETVKSHLKSEQIGDEEEMVEEEATTEVAAE